MSALHLVRETSAPPTVVWSVLSDFAAYGSWMPLTRMRLDPGEPRPGWGFAGVSGIGPVAFADSMVVTEWVTPQEGTGARFRVLKTGRVLGGWAQVQVLPRGAGTRVVWDQDLTLPLLPRWRPVDAALGRAAGWLYARALDAMLADAVRRTVERAR
jgi:hypothetical protein